MIFSNVMASSEVFHVKGAALLDGNSSWMWRLARDQILQKCTIVSFRHRCVSEASELKLRARVSFLAQTIRQKREAALPAQPVIDDDLPLVIRCPDESNGDNGRPCLQQMPNEHEERYYMIIARQISCVRRQSDSIIPLLSDSIPIDSARAIALLCLDFWYHFVF